jgi:predicted transcriptional regulator
MTKNPLKRHLNRAAKMVTDDTTLEDVIKYLEFMVDIDESEAEEKRGEYSTHEEVMERSKKWLTDEI